MNGIRRNVSVRCLWAHENAESSLIEGVHADIMSLQSPDTVCFKFEIVTVLRQCQIANSAWNISVIADCSAVANVASTPRLLASQLRAVEALHSNKCNLGTVA